MNEIILHEKYGTIHYKESVWTCKKSISIDGTSLEKVSKNEFKMKDGSVVTVFGSYLIGATMCVNDELIVLTSQIKWYEIVMGFMPLLLIALGELESFCSIVPFVGGALGHWWGALSAVVGVIFSIAGIIGVRKTKSIWLKIVVLFVILGAEFAVCTGIGCAIVANA